MALANHTPCRHEHQSIFPRGLIRSGLQNHLSDPNDVSWELSVANRILSQKLQQRRRTKVVAAFEEHMLIHELGMLPKPVSQARNIAGVEQFYSLMEERIGYAFVVG